MTATPNIGFDIKASDHYTFSIIGGYNPFVFNSSSEGKTIERKLTHWSVMPEFKYWFAKAFERSFIGLHGIYTSFEIGQLDFPNFFKDYNYDGYGAGAGLSWGYQWAFGSAWGLEASFGVGYIYFRYDKYDKVNDVLLGKFRTDYIGPTKVDVSLVYYF